MGGRDKGSGKIQSLLQHSFRAHCEVVMVVVVVVVVVVVAVVVVVVVVVVVEVVVCTWMCPSPMKKKTKVAASRVAMCALRRGWEMWNSRAGRCM